jgi:DNA-binding GntR family transcriptional regulator
VYILGVVLTRVDAENSNAEDTELLGVTRQRGMLRMNCVTFGSHRRPISLETTRYRSDRYRFRVTLERHWGNDSQTSVPGDQS